MKYLKDVVTLKYTAEKCAGCGMCVDVCPRGVFEMKDKRAVITDKDLCIECGACMNNCAYDAIWVKEGVGCAAAQIYSIITGKEPQCGCSKDGEGGCC